MATPVQIIAGLGYRVRACPQAKGEAWAAFRPDGSRVAPHFYENGRVTFAEAWAAAARDFSVSPTPDALPERTSLAVCRELKDLRSRAAGLARRIKDIESSVANELESATVALRTAAGAFSGERDHKPESVAGLLLQHATARYDVALQAAHDLEAVPLNY